MLVFGASTGDVWRYASILTEEPNYPVTQTKKKLERGRKLVFLTVLRKAQRQWDNIVLVDVSLEDICSSKCDVNKLTDALKHLSTAPSQGSHFILHRLYAVHRLNLNLTHCD